MKIRFEEQDYQMDAVRAVVDCFLGQPKVHVSALPSSILSMGENSLDTDGEYWSQCANPELALDDEVIIENIRAVQQRGGIPESSSLNNVGFAPLDELQSSKRQQEALKYRTAIMSASNVHLDIEMETGTGKTYCYIRTMFELNRKYGWKKFIVIVPSIAIREGVQKAFEITQDHFAEIYQGSIESFVYDSRYLSKLKAFTRNDNLSAMIINMQAFNARGRDRRIYERLEEFQSGRPIDSIAICNPVVILDEPQKMSGEATSESLVDFNPMFMIRYSATHSKRHHLIYRLGAVEAYRRNLVKHIVVRGIRTESLSGANCYMFFEGIILGKGEPKAMVEIEVKQSGGKIVRKRMSLSVNDSLYELSGYLQQYNGYDALQIDAKVGAMEFKNGVSVRVGDAVGDTTETDIRRIQIREALQAHFEKEEIVYEKGIKVLTLFFIDQVAKYRDYKCESGKGEYAKIFEEEYRSAKTNVLTEELQQRGAYYRYLNSIAVEDTHCGYFSIDKKTGKMRESMADGRSGESTDGDAFNLIMREKERLLSFDEPVRFIFTHSALREGWDNTNVFNICMLKNRNRKDEWRQEVGRGLRLCVNNLGERQMKRYDNASINQLTVIANDSYENVVGNLQTDIVKGEMRGTGGVTVETLGRSTILRQGQFVQIGTRLARILYGWLMTNEYIDEYNNVTEKYLRTKNNIPIAKLPDGVSDIQSELLRVVDKLMGLENAVKVYDGRQTIYMEPNSNFHTKEFRRIWSAIKQKAVWRMEIGESELIDRCVEAINCGLTASSTIYFVEAGEQSFADGDDVIRFRKTEISASHASQHKSSVRYDLVGMVAKESRLPRRTIAQILTQISSKVFCEFGRSPESFISKMCEIVRDVRAVMAVEGIVYKRIDQMHSEEMFSKNQTYRDLAESAENLKKHIYDYVITDSRLEERFARDLDRSKEVVVFAKLPLQYRLSTPFGDYVPDWAIVFDHGVVKHVYFVAETKGSMRTLNLRGLEACKVQCAKKFFGDLAAGSTGCEVVYDIVESYEDLIKKANT